MDGRNDFFSSEIANFDTCRDILKKLVYRDTDESKKELSTLLDDLIGIEYSLNLADEQVTGWVLTQCCYLVPLKHDVLVTKVCHLASNMLSKQQMVMNTGLETLTEYLIKALQTCQGWTYSDLLRALGVVLYETGGKVTQFHASLLGSNGYLLQLAKAKEDDIVRGAMQCIENICIRTASAPYLAEEYYKACLKVLLEALQEHRPTSRDAVIHDRVIISGLRGINCIILGTKVLDSDLLGPLLGALKIYMLYGLPGMPTAVPQSLYPTPLSKYDPSTKDSSDVGAVAGNNTVANADVDTENKKGDTKSSKNKKGKKRRGRGKKSDKSEDNAEDKNLADDVSKLSVSHDQSQNTSASITPGCSISDTQSPFLPWTRANISSESEYSDTEGGQSSKLRMLHCKVRQCALSCFHALVKAVEKRLMFGYWPSFIPDTPGAAGPTLFTGIMKDPSPKARAGALAVLTALVDGSKQYLMAAEEVDQYRNAPFTPFSVNLGHMIKEIHRCLLLSLVSETSPLATTQIIKCLATLIPSVPYSRLRPGLLSRIIKQIRPFISHRDPNIRVACLTCLGSMASVQAPMIEVLHLLQTPHPPTRFSEASGLPQSFTDPLSTRSDSQSSQKLSESGYQSNNSGEVNSGLSPGVPTPVLSSGAQTPSMSEKTTYGHGGDLSWLVKLCVRNVAPHLLETPTADAEAVVGVRVVEGQGQIHPLPVRLESLQDLAVLAKNYFPLLRPCLFMMRDLAYFCLEDKEPAVKLHGIKLVEELGAVILQQYSDGLEDRPDLKTMTDFWMPLLNEPLPKAAQTVDYHVVKSTVCDCLANIGPHIFELLPTDKRILCITLMLGLCNDEDHHVRAAAIRALGIYVLYPCLREDVSFVADVANCIIKALSEQILSVRVKAAWSLGNLSDALVLNRNDHEEAFIEDFSDMLLLKLFEAAIRASNDNDKVKSNAVRGLGNLLRYLPDRSLRSSRVQPILESAIQALVKTISTGTMKVRWNACYATGNMFKNSLLPLGKSPWTVTIYTALCSVVKDCKNFKVRINAALTFSIPMARNYYGDTAQYCTIWKSLITSLKTSESITDFTEYKYRDNLTEQVCSSLVHMFVFLEAEDLEEFCSCFVIQEECVQLYMDRYKLILHDKQDTHDKVNGMLKAQQHAKQTAIDASSHSLKDCMDKCDELFSMEQPEPPEYDDSQMTSPPQPPKSGFKQTYD